MGGGGETKTQTVQNNDPWAGQQPYLQDAMSQAQQIYDQQKGQNTPGYTGDFYAAPQPGMVSAFQNALSSTQSTGAQAVQGQANTGNALTGMGTAGTGAAMGGLFNFASQDPTQSNIASASQYAANPYMDSVVDAATRDATRGFNEQTMPGIDRAAAATGNTNSTRTGVAQGIAERGLQDTIADTSANLRGSAYSDGLQLAQQGQNNTLQALMGAGNLAGGASATGVGALGSAVQSNQTNTDTANLASTILQGYDQQGIDNTLQQIQYQQALPWQNLQNYWSVVGDKSWGGTTTSTGSQQTNPSLMSSLGSGAAVLGSLFRSDRRIKNIYFEKGRTIEGLPMYVWSYKDDPNSRVYHGPMAQDVQSAFPEAVVEIDGILHIDLSKYDWR